MTRASIRDGGGGGGSSPTRLPIQSTRPVTPTSTPTSAPAPATSCWARLRQGKPAEATAAVDSGGGGAVRPGGEPAAPASGASTPSAPGPGAADSPAPAGAPDPGSSVPARSDPSAAWTAGGVDGTARRGISPSGAPRCGRR